MYLGSDKPENETPTASAFLLISSFRLVQTQSFERRLPRSVLKSAILSTQPHQMMVIGYIWRDP